MAFVGETSHGLTGDEEVRSGGALLRSCPAEAFSRFVLQDPIAQDPIAALDQHYPALDRFGSVRNGIISQGRVQFRGRVEKRPNSYKRLIWRGIEAIENL